jgi:uncharacterized protein YhaN
MRTVIERVRVLGFGALGEGAFEFAPGLNVIEGGNGAGKSTLFELVTQVLFGFEKKSSGRRYESSGPEYGGEVTLSDAAGALVVRRVSSKKRAEGELSLRDLTGAPQAESRYTRALSGMQKSTFRELHVLSLDELRDFGRLGSDAELRAALSGSVMGQVRFSEVLGRWSMQADELFGSKAQRRPLNLLLLESAHLKQAFEALVDAPDVYASQLRARARAQAECEAASSDLSAHQKQFEAMLTLQNLAPKIQRFCLLSAQPNPNFKANTHAFDVARQKILSLDERLEQNRLALQSLFLDDAPNESRLEGLRTADELIAKFELQNATEAQFEEEQARLDEDSIELNAQLNQFSADPGWLRTLNLNGQVQFSLQRFAVEESALASSMARAGSEREALVAERDRDETALAQLEIPTAPAEAEILAERASWKSELLRQHEVQKNRAQWQTVAIFFALAILVGAWFATAILRVWAVSVAVLILVVWRVRTFLSEPNDSRNAVWQRMERDFEARGALGRIADIQRQRQASLAQSIAHLNERVEVAERGWAAFSARSDAFRDTLSAELIRFGLPQELSAQQALLVAQQLQALQTQLRQHDLDKKRHSSMGALRKSYSESFEQFEKAMEKLGMALEVTAVIGGLADQSDSQPLRRLKLWVKEQRAFQQKSLESRARRTELEGVGSQLAYEHEAVSQTLKRMLDEARVSNTDDFREVAQAQQAFDRDLAESMALKRECEERAALSIEELTTKAKSLPSSAALHLQREALSTRQRTVNEALKRLGAIEETLRNLEADTRRVSTPQALAVCASRMATIAQEHAIRRLGVALLRKAQQKVEHERRPTVLRRASELLQNFSGDEYVNVILHEDKDSVSVVDSRGKTWPLSRLSRGTRELTLLAFRLAMASQVFAHHASLPLLLDDVQVNLDEPRRQRLWSVLSELARTHQILIATCHKHAVQDLMRLGAHRLSLRSSGQLELL